jgi:hypothetical protein
MARQRVARSCILVRLSRPDLESRALTSLLLAISSSRNAGALAGYYALFVEQADSPRAVHDIKTELTHRKGRVLALTSVSEHTQ